MSEEHEDEDEENDGLIFDLLDSETGRKLGQIDMALFLPTVDAYAKEHGVSREEAAEAIAAKFEKRLAEDGEGMMERFAKSKERHFHFHFPERNACADVDMFDFENALMDQAEITRCAIDDVARAYFLAHEEELRDKTKWLPPCGE